MFLPRHNYVSVSLVYSRILGQTVHAFVALNGTVTAER
jgi:hypothetical protein